MLPSFKASFEVAIKWEKEREYQEAINDEIEPYYNIEIEKSRATGGKALKYYVPLKENKTIINGIEINAEQTLFSE
ncbi:hypothetical protein CUM33_05310 [Campylobacter jejuni]|nr:hypothetical protein [Campylobacter jejuni]